MIRNACSGGGVARSFGPSGGRSLRSDQRPASTETTPSARAAATSQLSPAIT